jgi:hypothetical protein
MIGVDHDQRVVVAVEVAQQGDELDDQPLGARGLVDGASVLPSHVPALLIEDVREVWMDEVGEHIPPSGRQMWLTPDQLAETGDRDRRGRIGQQRPAAQLLEVSLRHYGLYAMNCGCGLGSGSAVNA